MGMVPGLSLSITRRSYLLLGGANTSKSIVYQAVDTGDNFSGDMLIFHSMKFPNVHAASEVGHVIRGGEKKCVVTASSCCP